MPRASSPDLFLLVNSLSLSEWKTLRILFKQNPHNPNSKKKKTQDTERFAEVLRSATEYDKFAIMDRLGIPNSTKGNQTYRDLKRQCEKMVFKAIEYSPENQSPIVELRRFQILLPHLIERGYFEKAGKLIRNFIEVARSHEYFEEEKWLLDSLSLVLSKSKQTVEGERIIKNSIRRRKVLNAIIEECETVIDIRNQLQIALGEAPERRVERIRKLAKTVSLYDGNLHSTKARVIQAEVFRQIAVYLGKWENFLLAQKEILSLYKNHPNHFIDNGLKTAFLNSIFAKAEYFSMIGKFHEAKGAISELLRIQKTLVAENYTTAQELHLLATMTLKRMSLEEGGLIESVKLGNEWIAQKPSVIGRSKFPIVLYRAAEASFFLGRFSESAKLFSRINHGIGFKTRKDLLFVSLLILPIIRIEQNDTEGLDYATRQSAGYLKKVELENSFSEIMITFFKSWAKQGGLSKTKECFLGLRKQLNDMPKSSSMRRYLDYFDFYAWTQAHLESKTMLDVLRASSASISK